MKMSSRAKKRKISPNSKKTNNPRKRRTEKHGNYSIKPPTDAGSRVQDGELKFNYKTLRFEKISSTTSSPDRKQSMGGATEGMGVPLK